MPEKEIVMKQKTGLRWRALLSLLLCFVLAASGCMTPGSGGTSATTPAGGDQPGGDTPGGDKPADPTLTDYPNGAVLDGIGDRIPEGAAVLSAPVYDESAFSEITASALRNIFREDVAPGQRLRLKDGTYSFTAKGKVRDAAGMIIIAPEGLSVKDAEGMTLKNLTVIGKLTVINSPAVRLENVTVIAAGETALSVDAASAGVTLDACRIEGKTAIENSAEELVLLSSYIGFAENGVVDTSAGRLFIRDCRLIGERGSAVKTAGTGVELRQSTVKTDKASVALEIGAGANILIAANRIEDAQLSLSVAGADNLSVIRNSAVTLRISNGKHIYAIDNALGGTLTLADNDYLIADGNAFPDGKTLGHTVESGNTNTNGDNLMDVNARLAAGADPNLLPHVDKLQFVGVTPAETVFDPDGALALHRYVDKYARADDYVYVAPGAYAALATWNLGAAHADTTVYVYGAYVERPMNGTQDGNPGLTDYWSHISVRDTENVSVKGGTYAYERPQCAQAYVIEKIPKTSKVIVKTAAGMLDEFGATGTGDILFETSGGMAFRQGSPYPYVELGNRKEERNADGTITVTLRDSVYAMVRVGDVFACHNKLGASSHVAINSSKDILCKDMTIYGNTGAACFGENYSSVTYYRVSDLPDAGRPIDKATYDAYKELESTYKIKTDVWTDGENYYGAPSRFSSKDATHVASAIRGSHAISCRFESMIDDATNQRSAHARLSGIYDNGDGTATVVYKPNLYKVAYDRDYRTPSGLCEHFKVGDRVYIYTSDGKLVVDSAALTASVKGQSMTTEYASEGGNPISTWSITVKTADVNFDNLAGMALDKQGATGSNCNKPTELKALVDNRSLASDNFVFDNVYASNIRSRAMLVKSSGGTIKNCTFENIAQAVIAIYYELQWGESGVSENVTVANNLMINVGYMYPETLTAAPITVQSLGYNDFSLTALYNNIKITGNVIESRGTKWAVYVEGASDITITGNDFGSEWNLLNGSKPKHSVCLDRVNRVTIEGNIYPDPRTEIRDTFAFKDVKGLTGGDVDGGAMFPEFQ